MTPLGRLRVNNICIDCLLKQLFQGIYILYLKHKMSDCHDIICGTFIKCLTLCNSLYKQRL